MTPPGLCLNFRKNARERPRPDGYETVVAQQWFAIWSPMPIAFATSQSRSIGEFGALARRTQLACAPQKNPTKSKRNGAVEKTRTSTAFRPQRPQRCASTSSATTAHREGPRRPGRRQARASSKGKRAPQWLRQPAASAFPNGHENAGLTAARTRSFRHGASVNPAMNRTTWSGQRRQHNQYRNIGLP